ncbi:MAG: Stp1/IreP family PP2C-type Ser/Thr phosphatase [Solirubrobacteraceae bacterium]
MLRTVETAVRTDLGLQRRSNEDSSYASAPLFVVADGMGGARAGEVASQLAIDAFMAGLPSAGTPEERLAAVVQRANQEIYRRSLTDPESAGMGTTVTAALLEGDGLAIAHVGDSRAYLLRERNLTRLTEDHSLVEELVRGGKLTEAEAHDHPQRSVITRALGIEPVVVIDTLTCPLRAGDVVLLCSDGLTSMLEDPQVRDAVAESASLYAAADRLINDANAAGGRDNITVVLFRVQEADPAHSLDEPTMIARGAELEARPGGSESRLTGGWRPGGSRSGGSRSTLPLARIQGKRLHMPAGFVQRSEHERHFGAVGKAFVTLVALAFVLFLVGGAGYLAGRHSYFLGTDSQGTVVVYKGFPYTLPLGVPLYSTFYVSGVPALTIPARVRGAVLNHALRDQSSAIKLINDLELGKITG